MRPESCWTGPETAKPTHAAGAEVGEHRHELTGTIAFAAWLGVHAVLLTTMRARLEAFEWAGDYFGGTDADPVLGRLSETKINWNSGGEDEQPGAKG